MAVSKDDSGRRFVQVEVEVPGTPEEVWQAIATAEGITSWFVPTKTEHDEQAKVVGESVHRHACGSDSWPDSSVSWQCFANLTSWVDLGEYLFEVIMRRHGLRSTMMTSNQIDEYSHGLRSFLGESRHYHYDDSNCLQHINEEIVLCSNLMQTSSRLPAEAT
ncbi:MAG: hypothetical protein MI725_11805 [Pirellulales bacterium]|nr:hypothetical protein [Pirellulales bacterium]